MFVCDVILNLGLIPSSNLDLTAADNNNNNSTGGVQQADQSSTFTMNNNINSHNMPFTFQFGVFNLRFDAVFCDVCL